jgi:hypothetical protein
MNIGTVSLICVTGAVIMGCGGSTSSSCDIDENFKRSFDNAIAIARTRATFDSLSADINPIEVYRSFASLEAITGNASHSPDLPSDIKGYENIEDFRLDSLAWTEWYEKNKCSFTMQMADDIFNKEVKAFPNYDDPEIMESIREKFTSEKRDSARYLDSVSIVKYRITWPQLQVN